MKKSKEILSQNERESFVRALSTLRQVLEKDFESSDLEKIEVLQEFFLSCAAALLTEQAYLKARVTVLEKKQGGAFAEYVGH